MLLFAEHPGWFGKETPYGPETQIDGRRDPGDRPPQRWTPRQVGSSQVGVRLRLLSPQTHLWLQRRTVAGQSLTPEEQAEASEAVVSGATCQITIRVYNTQTQAGNC